MFVVVGGKGWVRMCRIDMYKLNYFIEIEGDLEGIKNYYKLIFFFKFGENWRDSEFLLYVE